MKCVPSTSLLLAVALITSGCALAVLLAGCEGRGRPKFHAPTRGDASSTRAHARSAVGGVAPEVPERPEHVVFVSNRDGDTDIYAAAPGARRVVALTRDRIDESGVSLPSSRGWFAVARQRRHGVPVVALVSPDGSHVRRLGRGTYGSIRSAGLFSHDGRW